MPTYDYRCRSCGHTIEVIHSMLDKGPSSCGVCGGELKRVFYPTGIIFKGSGFYKTDSRRADRRPST
ncbi:MAG: FmdB family zinc ribbon protein, partial [Candidatus Limnocylindria bacterium]